MATNTVTMFGFTFELSPVAFTLPIGKDGWSVYWYGIMIALGFLLAFLYGIKRAPKLSVDPDRLLDAVLITTPIAILSARAYYLLFYSPATFFKDFLDIHNGGLAIYGGVIGAVIGAVIACKIRKLQLIDCLDVAAPCFLIGQGIGRWGNFFNQEAFGTDTTLPWGMFSTGSSGTYEHIVQMGNAALDPSKPVHPCFLYESIWCAIGFILLNYVITRRKFRGQLVLLYGMWYGFGRFLIEGLRTDSLMLGSLRVSQLLSAVIVLAAAAAYIVLWRRTKEKSAEKDYRPVFETGETSDSNEGDGTGEIGKTAKADETDEINKTVKTDESGERIARNETNETDETDETVKADENNSGSADDGNADS